MYTMWDAPSDRDYYEQFNPEPPEDEEPEPELEPENSEPYGIAPASDYSEEDGMVDPFAPSPENPSSDEFPEVA